MTEPGERKSRVRKVVKRPRTDKSAPRYTPEAVDPPAPAAAAAGAWSSEQDAGFGAGLDEERPPRREPKPVVTVRHAPPPAQPTVAPPAPPPAQVRAAPPQATQATPPTQTQTPFVAAPGGGPQAHAGPAQPPQQGSHQQPAQPSHQPQGPQGGPPHQRPWQQRGPEGHPAPTDGDGGRWGRHGRRGRNDRFEPRGDRGDRGGFNGPPPGGMYDVADTDIDFVADSGRPPMNLGDLQRLPMADVHRIAVAEQVTDFAGLRKQELIFRILRTKVERRDPVFAQGVIEVLPDGFGFLRSPAYSYVAAPDDVYVSPSQVRRFNLKTGMQIYGPVRPPKPGERYFALLRVERIEEWAPDQVPTRTLFEDLTPLYPHTRLLMETAPTGLEMRIMDIVTPIGKG